MDSINLQQQILIDHYLDHQLTPKEDQEFRTALKAPEFAEALALQRDLQSYLWSAPERSPLKKIFEEISQDQRIGD